MTKKILQFALGAALMATAPTGLRAQNLSEAPAAAPAKKSAAPANREAVRAREISELLTAIQQLQQLLAEQKRELEEQRALLLEQQQRLAALPSRVEENGGNAAAAAPQNLPATPAFARAEDVRLLEGQLEAVADTTKELGERVSKVQSDSAAAKSAADAKFRQIGNFTFSGDFRARYEPFFGGTLSSARNRERFRMRFNVTSKFNDEFSGGLSVASGDSNDPISTNQTFTNFYQRKFFGIDKAFVQYTPRWFKPFNVTAGKFAYTWYRTELTLDNDMNPEGISESLGWDFKNPVFKRFAVVAFHLPFFESSSRDDSVMHGGQVQTVWQFGDRYRFSAYAGFYNWHRPDAIRAAQVSSALGGSSNTNAATASQFASNFGVLDLTGRLDVKTWSTRWPMMVQLNFANNTRACTNLKNISGTQPACNPRDRSAYWAETQFGQTREQGDINFGYTFMRIEREAVLAAFNFSDLRSPTNNLTHRVNFNYQAYRNVTLGFTGLFGRQLVTASTPNKEDILKRLQIDLIYKF